MSRRVGSLLVNALARRRALALLPSPPGGAALRLFFSLCAFWPLSLLRVGEGFYPQRDGAPSAAFGAAAGKRSARAAFAAVAVKDEKRPPQPSFPPSPSVVAHRSESEKDTQKKAHQRGASLVKGEGAPFALGASVPLTSGVRWYLSPWCLFSRALFFPLMFSKGGVVCSLLTLWRNFNSSKPCNFLPSASWLCLLWRPCTRPVWLSLT